MFPDPMIAYDQICPFYPSGAPLPIAFTRPLFPIRFAPVLYLQTRPSTHPACPRSLPSAPPIYPSGALLLIAFQLCPSTHPVRPSPLPSDPPIYPSGARLLFAFQPCLLLPHLARPSSLSSDLPITTHPVRPCFSPFITPSSAHLAPSPLPSDSPIYPSGSPLPIASKPNHNRKPPLQARFKRRIIYKTSQESAWTPLAGSGICDIIKASNGDGSWKDAQIFLLIVSGIPGLCRRCFHAARFVMPPQES